MEINGRTRLCGLIGNPVEHTQSPAIHNTLADLMNINMAYVPFHVENGRLGDAIKGAYGLNILGMNVTVPYKNDVIPFLKDIDDMAGNIGAVNTLVRVDGGYKGYNTDITGLRRAMESDGVTVGGEEVIILGAGGVGRAVTFMCASSGAKKVYLLNRNADKAVCVADEVNGKLGIGSVIPMSLSDYTKLIGNSRSKYLVIQATSVGLAPNINDTAIDDIEFYKCISAGYDLIYNPWETKFMKLVKANGGQAFNGLKMLLYQGIDAFELWNNCHVPDESAYIIYNKLMDNIRKK
jgi:shikimate dehydrogenase